MVNGISSNLIENFANFTNTDNEDTITEMQNNLNNFQKQLDELKNESNNSMNHTESNNKSGKGQQNDSLINYRPSKGKQNDSLINYRPSKGQQNDSIKNTRPSNGQQNDSRSVNEAEDEVDNINESRYGNKVGLNNIYEGEGEGEGEVEGEGEGEGEGEDVSERPESNYGDGTGLNDITDPEEFDNEEVMEEFGALDKPIYEGFTNSDFNASNLVRGRNLHNLLKALLISLVLCSLNHKDVSKMVVDPLVKLVHNKLSHSTMVCVLVFVVSYIVIAFL